MLFDEQFGDEGSARLRVVGERGADLFRELGGALIRLHDITVVGITVSDIPTETAAPQYDRTGLMEKSGGFQAFDERGETRAYLIRHSVALEPQRCAEADPTLDPGPLRREVGRRPFERIVTGAKMPQLPYAVGKVVPGVFDDWRKLDRQVNRAVVPGPNVTIGRRVPAIVA